MTTAAAPAPLDLAGCPLEGRNRIEASAGTGKTRAIAALFLRLLLEPSGGRREPLPVSRILVVTFTDAAAEELKGRIRDEVRRLSLVLGGAMPKGADEALLALAGRHGGSGKPAALLRLRAALRDFDRASISTIHGFCAGVLRDRPFESRSSFEAELVPEQADLVSAAVDDYLRLAFYPASFPFLAAVRGEVTREAMGQVASRVGQVPGARLIPAPSPGALAAAERDLVESFAGVTAAWAREREAVLAILFDPGSALSRSQKAYPPERIRLWAEELDAVLAAGREPSAFPDAAEWLAAGRLADPDNLKKRGTPPAHPFFDACEQLVTARRRLVAQVKAGVSPFLAVELPRRKEEASVRGYQDLLSGVRDAVGDRPDTPLAATLRRRWPAALIDEFQDTDPLQFGIFDVAWRGDESTLFLVGDPKQSIYSFRGADLYAYLASGRSGNGEERRYLLGSNYRSVPGLVASVNALFSARARAFLTEGVDFFPTGAAGKVAPLSTPDGPDPAPFRMWFLPRRGRTADGGERPLSKKEIVPAIRESLADEVVRLLRAGRSGELTIAPRDGSLPRGVLPRDIAVLVRENREAAELQKVLAARGVPAVIGSQASVWGSVSAEELFRVLSAIASPGDERKARAALATSLLGAGGDLLAAMPEGGGEWARWMEAFRRAHEAWATRGFSAMAWNFLARHGVRARLLAREGGERALTDLLHLIELLHRESHRRSLGMEGVLKTLGKRLADPSAGEDCELRLESDEEALRISTFHRSKGLQWPIVFCPFPWGGARKADGPWLEYHDAEGRPALDLRDPQDRREGEEAWRREQKAESVRLLYVALTRASHRCYATWGAVANHGDSAMNWLLHGEENGFPTDERMRADLAALAAVSGGMRVEDLPRPDPARSTAAREGGEAARPLASQLSHRLRADWTVTSFSALADSGPAEGGRERDEAAPPPMVASEAPDDLFGLLAPGADSGILLHELFERVDFSDPLGPGASRLARRLLAGHGLDPKGAPELLRGAARALSLPLEPEGPVLGSLAPGDRMTEMGFFLPRAAFSAAEWAGALSRHGEGRCSPAFLARIARLSFPEAAGLLNGFIDLVFRHGGRVFLLDWKSNRLPGYGPGDLAAAMEESLYLLQAHLYAVALHRHLARTLPGYDYDRHFGGVYYPFLRGMGAGSAGVWRDRPPRGLVEALSGFFPPPQEEP